MLEIDRFWHYVALRSIDSLPRSITCPASLLAARPWCFLFSEAVAADEGRAASDTCILGEAYQSLDVIMLCLFLRRAVNFACSNQASADMSEAVPAVTDNLLAVITLCVLILLFFSKNWYSI